MVVWGVAGVVHVVQALEPIDADQLLVIIDVIMTENTTTLVGAFRRNLGCMTLRWNSG